MIYLWLKQLKTMQVYRTHEEFQNILNYSSVSNEIRNEYGFQIMIEENTKYWND